MKKALSIFCFFIIAFVNIFAIDGNAYAFDGEYVDKFGKWYNKGTVIDILKKVWYYNIAIIWVLQIELKK